MKIKERKLRHYFEKGAIYFVTSVTKDRKEIFKNTSAAQFLVITIVYHKYILNFSLFGYVVMSEHFHLLLQPDEKYPLPKIMNYIKGNFARKYNEFLNPLLEQNDGSRPLRVGYDVGMEVKHVWQKEYYESVIRDEDDFIEKLNYIHNNPVKRGLVDSPEKYEFSSYYQYFGERRNSVQIPIDKILL